MMAGDNRQNHRLLDLLTSVFVIACARLRQRQTLALARPEIWEAGSTQETNPAHTDKHILQDF